jgi:hypothetical protein
MRGIGSARVDDSDAELQNDRSFIVRRLKSDREALENSYFLRVYLNAATHRDTVDERSFGVIISSSSLRTVGTGRQNHAVAYDGQN